MTKIGEAYRQESIIDYMFLHGKNAGYTTREIANSGALTTSAVQSAFKRLRKKGRVYYFEGKWFLSSHERLQRLDGAVPD